LARRHARRQTTVGDDTIRIVLVEPRTLVGIGVRRVLDDAPGIEVVAEVRSAEEALPVVARTTPDVVLLDTELSEPDVCGHTRRLHHEAPDSALVVVGREDDDASIIGAIEVGARAHVAEFAAPDELVSAIRRAADGEDPLKEEILARPDLVERVVDAVREAYLPAGEASAVPLTGRELEILRYVADGLRNRDIADHLGVSEQTVKNHLTHVLDKTGAPNRTQAVTHAVRHGWFSLDAYVGSPFRGAQP
jgi:DNA-binding NarL/FixJ family response regulator